jgi:hypothetical protein
MNTVKDNPSMTVDGSGGDPFALTENCDYPLPSKVSAAFCSYVVETRLQRQAPRETCRPDLAAALAQTLGGP